MLMLVVSELSEALEADRRGRYADISRLDFILGENAVSTEEQHFKIKFEHHVKDTFEDEIADTFIRLFDFSVIRITINRISYVDGKCTNRQ